MYRGKLIPLLVSTALIFSTFSQTGVAAASYSPAKTYTTGSNTLRSPLPYPTKTTIGTTSPTPVPSNPLQSSPSTSIKKSKMTTPQSITPSTSSSTASNDLKPNSPRDKNRPQYVKDKVIAKFRPSVTPEKKYEINNKLSLKTNQTLKSTGMEVLKITNGNDPKVVVDSLLKSGLVESAQPDYLYYPTDITNDPRVSELWGLNNVGQSIRGQNGLTNVDVDAPEAWNLLPQSAQSTQDVIVAVIDTGVDINHPDLKDHIWTNPNEAAGLDNDHDGLIGDVHGWDFFNKDNSLYDEIDGDNHATHVSGTIAASANNQTGVAGVAGVVPNVKIMPLKFIGPYGGDTLNAIQALEYARSHGAKVVNASWGSGPNGYPDPLLRDAIANSGMLFIASAGNDGVDLDQTPVYPASYNLPNMINVAALNKSGAITPWSNYGAHSVHVGAPGNEILSTIPAKSDTGAGVLVSDDPSYHFKSLYLGFGLEDVDEIGNRVDLMAKALSPNALDITPASKILVVDDDESNSFPFPDVRNYYTSALSGYNYTVYDVNQGNDGPFLTDLSQYDAVIWFTGKAYGYNPNNNFPVALTYNDQQNLKQYLQVAGKKLFLSGSDAGFNMEGSDFYKDYLHARFMGEEDLRSDVVGVPNTTNPFNGVQYRVDGQEAYGFDPFRDKIDSDGVGTIVLQYPALSYNSAYGYMSGTSMAAPHVTGIAALYLSKNPQANINQTRASILESGKSLTSLNQKTTTGRLVSAAATLSSDGNDNVPGQRLDSPNTLTGTLDANGNRDDVYAVYLKQGEKITADLSWTNTAADFDLYLFDPSAQTVKSGLAIDAMSEQTNTVKENISFTANKTGTYFIDAYGYAGNDNYTLNISWGNVAGTYEDNDPAIHYSGSSIGSDWFKPTGAEYTRTKLDTTTLNYGAFATMDFIGTGIDWLAYTGPDQGYADVWLDGAKITTSNLYSATAQSSQLKYSIDNLPLGRHGITIKWIGKYDPAAKKGSSAVNVDAFVVKSGASISVPNNLKAQVNGDTVALTWDSSSLAGVTYNVYRSDIPYDPLANKITTQLTSNTFTDTALLPGTHYYSVSAVANDIESKRSSEVFAVISPKPLPPANLKANISSGNNVDLTWDASTSSSIKDYVIYRSTTTGTEYTQIGTSTTTSYTDPSLPSGTYYYVIAAEDVTGNVSAYSNEVPVTIASAPTPVGPGTYENDNANITYTGIWKTGTDAKFSGGSASYSNDSNASASLTFAGTGIKWTAYTGSAYGTADVYIDNQLAQSISLNNTTVSGGLNSVVKKSPDFSILLIATNTRQEVFYG